jgi:molecular chaperone GrpE
MAMAYPFGKRFDNGCTTTSSLFFFCISFHCPKRACLTPADALARALTSLEVVLFWCSISTRLIKPARMPWLLCHEMARHGGRKDGRQNRQPGRFEFLYQSSRRTLRPMTDKAKIKQYEKTEKATQPEAQVPPETGEDAPAESLKHPAETIAELQRQLETKTQEAKESFDRLLRVSAEFENYKKRTSKEICDFRKFATESLVRELLPIVDNLERALTSVGADDAAPNGNIIEGVQMTLQELIRVLKKFGVEAIDTVQKPFDPNYHQAMLQEESDQHPENTVLKEFQKGYLIHERLLRPAMVVVSKAVSGQDEVEP